MRIDIPGYEGLYAAEDTGQIWSYRKGGYMLPYENVGGYMRVNLTKEGKTVHEYVHRLVASAFCTRESGQDYIDHIDCDRKNNRADNLEWCTQKENIRRSRKHGHQKKDIPVTCRNMLTGETRVFQCLRYAASELFKNYWDLTWPYKRAISSGSTVFVKGPWVIEVAENGI